MRRLPGNRAADPALARFRAVSRGASCLLCAGVAFVNQLNLGGFDVTGDLILGRLHGLALAGCAAFVAGAAGVAASVRVAAVLAACGTGLCLPVYAYLLDPGLFARFGVGPQVVDGEDAYLLREWAVLGFVTVAVAVFAFVRQPRR